MTGIVAVLHLQESVNEWCRCMEFVVRQNGGHVCSVGMQNVKMLKAKIKTIKCRRCVAVSLLSVCFVQFLM